MPDDCVIIQFSTAAPPTWKERWRDKSFIDYSKMICKLTHSPFSHVDYVIQDEDKIQLNDALLGASNNPHAPIIATNPPGNPEGVALRPFNYQRFCIRRRATIPCTPEVKEKFHSFMWAQLGKPFDTNALKPSTFLSSDFSNRDWRYPTRWFCAEMAARAAEVSKLIPWKLVGVKNRVTASDLLLMLNPLMNVDEFWEPIAGLIVERWEE